MPKLEPGTVWPTPEEEAEINAGIAADPDTWELTEEDFKAMRPASEVHPEFVKSWREERGAREAAPKERVTINIDCDVIEHFRKDGPGWETRLNDTLHRAVFGR